MSAPIFISYRKDDTLSQAGRLHDSLEKIFGEGSVFYDNETLEPGQNWPEELKKHVEEATVVLLLYKDAPKWLGVNDFGQRRIDDPGDWVRLELETALNKGKILIPVLIGHGNSLPPTEALPDSLKQLHTSQHFTIRETHWSDDCRHLGQELSVILQKSQSLSPPNVHLAKTLVEAIAPYNPRVAQLNLNPEFWNQPANLNKILQFLSKNFEGEIGRQLQLLVNIAKETTMTLDAKKHAYVQKCLDITRFTLELVNFTLLSVIWDKVKTGQFTLLPEEKAQVNNLFETQFMLPLSTHLSLLHSLIGLYKRHPDTAFPFEEAPSSFFEEISPGKVLEKACLQLEKSQNPPKMGDAELQLAEILKHFAFLCNYRMVSLKKIQYLHWRNGKPEYLHRYVAIGNDVLNEKGLWSVKGEQTPAVLLYRGSDYLEGINLFPFVIDYNALTFEQGAKICFLSSRDLQRDNALEYRFLGDNSSQHIEKPDHFDPNAQRHELMMDKEKLKTYNLAGVVDGFLQAQAVLTGTDNNFYDNL